MYIHTERHTDTLPPAQHTSLHFHLSDSASVLKQKAKIKFGLFLSGSHLQRLREGVFKCCRVSAAPRAEQSRAVASDILFSHTRALISSLLS